MISSIVLQLQYYMQKRALIAHIRYIKILARLGCSLRLCASLKILIVQIFQDVETKILSSPFYFH